jgi:ABC-type multidrug transport system permease subunit
MKNGKINIVLGLIVICINVFLLGESIYLYYCYNFTDILYMFMYPNWVLLTNILLSTVGIFMAILLHKKKISIILFLIAALVLWLIIFSNYFFSTHY